MNVSPQNKFLYATDGTEAVLFQVSNIQPIVASDANTVEIHANVHQLGGTAATDTFVSAVITVTGNSGALLLALAKEITFGNTETINVLTVAQSIVPAATCVVTLTD